MPHIPNTKAQVFAGDICLPNPFGTWIPQIFRDYLLISIHRTIKGVCDVEHSILYSVSNLFQEVDSFP